MSQTYKPASYSGTSTVEPCFSFGEPSRGSVSDIPSEPKIPKGSRNSAMVKPTTCFEFCNAIRNSPDKSKQPSARTISYIKKKPGFTFEIPGSSAKPTDTNNSNSAKFSSLDTNAQNRHVSWNTSTELSANKQNNTSGSAPNGFFFGSALIEYSPVIDTDINVVKGNTEITLGKFHCITWMKNYEAKSLEELRLEDYLMGRGKVGTWPVKYEPVLSTDDAEESLRPVAVRCVSERPEMVNVKLCCITHMKQYESYSLEELRLQDYRAGRIGKGVSSPNTIGFLFGTPSFHLCIFCKSNYKYCAFGSVERCRTMFRKLNTSSATLNPSETSAELCGGNTDGRNSASDTLYTTNILNTGNVESNTVGGLFANSNTGDGVNTLKSTGAVFGKVNGRNTQISDGLFGNNNVGNSELKPTGGLFSKINVSNMNLNTSGELFKTNASNTESKSSFGLNNNSDSKEPICVSNPSPNSSLNFDTLSSLFKAVSSKSIASKPTSHWHAIFKGGLPEDVKKSLLQEYPISDNGDLTTRILKDSISTKLSEDTKKRDRDMQEIQDQIGHAITSIDKAMMLLFDQKKLADATRDLHNSCRLLADLHHSVLQHRINMIASSLENTVMCNNNEKAVIKSNAGAPQPIMPSQKVTDSDQEAVIANQEAAISNQEAAVPSQEAAVSNQEAAIASQEATIPSQEPTISSQEPTISSQKPTILSQEPTISSQEPTISSQEPAISGQ